MVIAKIPDKFLLWAYWNNYIFRNMGLYVLAIGK